MDSRATMEAKRTGATPVWIAAISGAVIAALLTAGAVRYQPAVYRFLASAGDDQPILVGGGSMHIYSPHGKFKKNANGDVVYETKDGQKRQLTTVDVYYFGPKGLQQDSANFGDLNFTYCPKIGPCDTVTLKSPNGQDLTFVSPKAPDLDVPGYITQEPQDGYIHEIQAGRGKKYACTADSNDKSRCLVIIHHCLNGQCL